MLSLGTPGGGGGGGGGGESKGTSQDEQPADDHFTEAVGFLSRYI